jgi:hypothetical protein
LSIPSDWSSYTGVSGPVVNALLQTKNYRIIDLNVDGVSGTGTPTFTLTVVSNTGAHYTNWWWYYGLTASQISTLTSANHARLTNLRAYQANGQERFAVVMVDNTAAAAKKWWFTYNSSLNSINQMLRTDNARLIDLSTATVAGQLIYDAVMVANTGLDATSWWYYVNVTPQEVTTLLKQNQAHLTEIQAVGSGLFAVIMVGNQGPEKENTWEYFGESYQDVIQQAKQNHARLVELDPYALNGQTVYVALMVRNAS